MILLSSLFCYWFLAARLLTGVNRFKRSAFNKTETELKLMAAPAIIGFKSGPPKDAVIPWQQGFPKHYKQMPRKDFL